ncbi:hypothetical protein JHK85_001304 [Glycine max]|nr:hypothetical protein JHK85_001304 [Glycine max]KAG5088654.1 hypothetical protein JHK86_001266 [Glycine max]
MMLDATTSKAEPTLDASSYDEDSQPDDFVNSNGEKKAHQVHLVDFVLVTTSPGSVQDASACEEVKALLDEKVSNGYKNLLKDFQDLEERVKSLTITLKDSKEWCKEMLNYFKKNVPLLMMNLIS